MDYRNSAEYFLHYMRKLNRTAMIRDLTSLASGEQAVLYYLAFQHDGASAGELTSAFDIRSSRTAAILNTLEKKGFARRLQNPQDKRQVLVYITEAGKQEVKGRYEDVISRMAEFLELLGPEDSEEFIRIVRDAVLRNIGK